MARVGTLQASFSSGELSPRLYGRADIARYQSGAEAIENFLVRPEGGLMRRHGTRFAGEVKDHSKEARVVPFIYSSGQAFVLVFEDLLIRFYKNGAPISSASNSISGISKANPAVLTYSGTDNFSNGDRVLVTGVSGMGQVNNREFTVANVNTGANTFELSGVNSSAYDTYTSGGTVSKIYTVTTTYLEADLPYLQFTQSADVLYIAHEDYAPATLSRASDASWTLAAISLAKGPFAPLNVDLTKHVFCTVTGSNYDPGDSVTIRSNASIFESGHAGSFMYLEERYYGDTDVIGYPIVNSAQPSLGAQISNAGNVYEVSGTSGATFVPGQPWTHLDGDVWSTGSGDTNRTRGRYLHSRWAVISLDTYTDANTMSGTIKTRLPNGLAPTSKSVTATANSSGRVRITSSAHGFGVGDYVYISGIVGTTEANGSWRVINVATNTFELEGSTYANAWVSGGTIYRYATYKFRFGAFSSARGFPSCVALHEQRLCFANTTAQPTGLWASRSGDYENFYPGTNDDDSISYNIASGQVDPIRWLASMQDLAIGTMGQEMSAFGGGLGDPITPTNTRIVPQSSEGSARVQAAKVSNSLVFTNRAARKLFSLKYQTDVNSYVSSDLLELAEHLSLGLTITQMAWAKNPASILWVLRSDGTVIACTYRPEQEVIAWTQHDFGGEVESICVIPSDDATTDRLWMSVKRTINASTRRYIEYLADPFEPTSATDKNAMGFVDCALQYSGSSTTSLTGLFHLEGESVKVVGNGALMADATVSNGKITLASAVTVAWVGKAYTSRVRTLRPEGAAQATAQGKMKRIPRITVRVHNSIGGTIGPADESQMDELVRRQLDDPMDASPPLYSGDVDCLLASDFDLAGRIAIVQSQPMPLDILALFPLQSVSEG